MTDFLKVMQNALTETAAQIPQVSNPQRVFTEIPQELSQRTSKAENRAGLAEAALNVLEQESARINEERIKRAEETSKQVTEISQADREAAERLLSDAQPLLQRRRQAIQRSDELSRMNPLAREIRGIFDRNYSRGYLEQEKRQATEGIRAIGEELQATTQLRDRVLTAIAREDASVADLFAAQEGAVQSGFQISYQQLSLARSRIDDLLKEVEGQGDVARTQMLLADKALSEMTPEQVNSALGAAGRSGKVLVGGVELTSGQLQQRMRQLNMQALAEQSQQLAVVGQQMGIEAQRRNLMLNSMSITDVRAALASGGRFRGSQLDVVALQERLGALLQGAEVEALDRGAAIGTRTQASLIQDAGQIVAATTRRVGAMYGPNLPPELARFNHEFVREMNAFREQIKAQQNPEAGQAAVRQAAGNTVKMLERLDSVIKGIAERSSRNPDVQTALISHMTGQPMTPEQGARSLRAFVQGGNLPPGMRTNAPAQAAIRNATEALTSLRKNPAYLEANQREKDKMEIEAVTRAAGSSWTRAYTSSIMDNLPQFARDSNHPLGQVSPQVYQSTRAAGDQIGIERIASQLNISPDELQMMFGRGPNANEIWKKAEPNAVKLGMSTPGEVYSRTVAAQTASWMQGLEAAQPGAARQLADFLQKPQTQTQLSQAVSSLGQLGLAENIVDSVSGGQIFSRLGDASTMISRAVVENERAAALKTITRYGQYNNNPQMRARAAISLNSQISAEEADQLMQAVTPLVQEQVRSRMAGLPNDAPPRAGSEMTYNAYANVIKNGKLQDPTLERIRRRAAAEWDQNQAAADRLMQDLGGR